VQMMNAIALNTEASQQYRQMYAGNATPENTTQDAVALAACEVADTLEAAAIVCFTATGSSAWRVARNRPDSIIAAFTPSDKVRNQLALARGVEPRFVQQIVNTEDMVHLAVKNVLEAKLAKPGDKIVIVAGVPFGMHGTTNMIRVERLS
jgi:pyruvate kinase